MLYFNICPYDIAREPHLLTKDSSGPFEGADFVDFSPLVIFSPSGCSGRRAYPICYGKQHVGESLLLIGESVTSHPAPPEIIGVQFRGVHCFTPVYDCFPRRPGDVVTIIKYTVPPFLHRVHGSELLLVQFFSLWWVVKVDFGESLLEQPHVEGFGSAMVDFVVQPVEVGLVVIVQSCVDDEEPTFVSRGGDNTLFIRAHDYSHVCISGIRLKALTLDHHGSLCNHGFQC